MRGVRIGGDGRRREGGDEMEGAEGVFAEDLGHTGGCIMNEDVQEEWRPVVGWEDMYSVSSLGRMATVPRFVPVRNGGKRYVRHRILKTQRDRYGYPIVTLCRNRQWEIRTIHRLLVRAFVGEIPDGMVINHKDARKDNNSLSNLEICTQQWNALHSRRVSKTNIGSDVINSKLTEEIVIKCRRALVGAPRGTMSKLARKYGVCLSAMGHACTERGRTWRHVSWPAAGPSA